MTNVSNGAPAYLAPDWRYAGDDWSGANALTYVVYATAPVYASDGVTITTPGVPRDLTGCTVTGTARYQSRCAIEAANPPGLVALVGAVIDTTKGVMTLSLAATSTAFPRQRLELWGDPRCALLIVQPKVVDAADEAVSVGLQPLFVF